LSKPSSNGYDTVINVKYPITEESDIENKPELEIKKSNIIIMEETGKELYISKNIQGSLPVGTDPKGYLYKNCRYDGKYCIMQIIASPFNEECFLLNIKTNNPLFMNKNFYMRKMILPAYMNGLHPHLNNQVLIYDEEGYKGIYETGGDIIKI
jgi:hypothetical protein